MAAASACGSSTKSQASPSTGSSSSSGPAASVASGTPITVGTIGTFSGPYGASEGGVKDTLNAWVSNTNAHGGINGHPVKLIIKDDAGSVTTGQQEAQELLTQDHVVAIVNDAAATGSDSAWGALAQKAGVPVIGGSAINVPFLTNPDFYASSTNAVAGSYAILALSKRNGPKLAVLYCAENPVCQASVAFYKAFAPGLGMTVTSAQGVSATAVDYTAVCQTIKDTGANSFVAVTAAQVVGRIASSCAQQGASVKNVEAAAAVDPTLLSVKAEDGALSAAVDFPFTDNSNAATAEFQSVLAKYAPPNTLQKYGFAINVPWVSMQLLAAAVKAGGSGPVTSASIKAGLYTMKGETLGGLAPPLTFVPGQANLQNCYFVLGITNGQFTSPDGLKTSCAPDAAVSAIVKQLTAH